MSVFENAKVEEEKQKNRTHPDRFLERNTLLKLLS